MEFVASRAFEVPEDTFGGVEVHLSWVFSKMSQLGTSVTEIWPCPVCQELQTTGEFTVCVADSMVSGSGTVDFWRDACLSRGECRLDCSQSYRIVQEFGE